MRKIIDLKGNHCVAFISNIEKLSEIECRSCVGLARNANMGLLNYSAYVFSVLYVLRVF